MLNRIEHGTPTERPGLVIVHGLYGSARNWGVIAKRLSDSRHVVAVDMRNHGASPWFETHSYEDLTGDLAEVIESLEGPYDVLGHSMGGKAAMVLALTRPELVNRLIVADIAPVTYGHSQLQYIKAMQAVDLRAVERRSDAAAQLQATVDNPALVPFFLQALDVTEKRWLLNLDTLALEMPKILSFPDISGVYEGKVMFLTGAESSYVTREHRDRIKALFPAAQFAKIPGAGHWLHAEKPREFEAAVRTWLG
ncbi:alpha/beta fold hydrolase [Thalassospira sp.]|uniref:alpha/beta fold hydrolase n=1 Tax=Thalassospira sp. TaxID=1912094 RepID=UPI000C5F85D7|nr:alpha/beta fold hydrolase [Thalassospira sp.]MAO01186.1 alpha/beta hydrolase [Roseovarius sp.]MBD12739.1 alpha/beta hydrolase [Roseovarius sp.]HBS22266.1 alpha/beta hydrolase [Thalassospira sp.]|tara:strand:- start:315 stop:1070 length:756 start_codon:yes stop_codon:yes gene_type:complete